MAEFENNHKPHLRRNIIRASPNLLRDVFTQRWNNFVAAAIRDPWADIYYGLLYSTYTVHVKLLTKDVVTVEVNHRWTVHCLSDHVRHYHASLPLNWPSTFRGCNSPFRVQLRVWDAVAALRLSHSGQYLDDTHTLAQAGVQPGSQLSAHMYFGQRGVLDEINRSRIDTQKDHQDLVSEYSRRRKKHIMDQDDLGRAYYIRQKFNEPLRNRQVHRMIDTYAGLKATKENAARYGLDMTEMEDILEALDGIDGGWDFCDRENGLLPGAEDSEMLESVDINSHVYQVSHCE